MSLLEHATPEPQPDELVRAALRARVGWHMADMTAAELRELVAHVEKTRGAPLAPKKETSP